MQPREQRSPPNLRKDFSWILIGNLYYAASQYALLIALTRLTTPETVGIFSLALAINGPISLFFSLSLRAVMISDSKKEYPLQAYLQVRVLTALLSILLVSGIVFIGKYSIELAIPILLIAGIKAIESIIDILYGIFQQEGENHRIAISMTVRGTMSSCLAVLILLSTSNLGLMCMGILGSSTLTLLFYDAFKARRFIPWRNLNHFNPAPVKILCWMSLPLAFATLLSSLEVNVPRYLIEHSIGLASLGIFSALSYPLMLGNQIIGALASAASPKLATLFDTQQFNVFKRLLIKLSGIGVIVGALTAAACLLFGREILSLLKHIEYVNDSAAFGILAIAAGISYVTVFFGAGLSAMKRFQAKFGLQIFSFVALVAFSFLAAQYKSVYSMSLAILAGSIVSFLSQLIVFFLQLHQSSQKRVLN